jgi:hypothetical protein
LLDKGVCLIAILDSCYSGGFASTQTYGSGLPDNYGTYHNPNIHSDTRLTETAQSAFAQSLALYFGRAASANAMANAQTWVLSAAGADEESWETATYGHGVFTYFLLQAGTAASGGLLRGDANLDGHLSLQEAQRYCLAAIEKNWNEAQPSSDLLTWDLQFKPHLSGNPLDILLF